MKRAILLVAAAAGAVALTIGCGVKSHPVPPVEARPAPIGDLHVASAARGLKLTWARPQTYEAGARMGNLGKFVISRASAGGPFAPLAVVPITDQGRFQVQRSFSFVDSTARLGEKYRYEIVSITTDGYMSRPSNVAETIRIIPRTPNPATFVLPTPTPIPLP